MFLPSDPGMLFGSPANVTPRLVPSTFTSMFIVGAGPSAECDSATTPFTVFTMSACHVPSWLFWLGENQTQHVPLWTR
ncbi:unannotated protein [freshwater metagenome]|uniref:Unannotated protein n=1 Tax=freshwater metagenome TaxID=449393 RepID=A0A6J6U2B2_9ZZZZ